MGINKIIRVFSKFPLGSQTFNHVIKSFFLQWVKQSIENIKEDISNYQLAYMTHQDICACFEGDTLLAIQVGLFNRPVNLTDIYKTFINKIIS